MTHRFHARAPLAAVLVVLGLTGTAFAKTDAALTCAAVKMKVAGAAASAILGCHAKAAQKGLTVDPECRDAVSAKLAAAFSKAEAAARKAKTMCPTEGDTAATQGQIDVFVADVVAALRPDTGASKCAAKKLGTVGKHAQKLLGTHAANLLKPDSAKSTEKIAKADAVLAAVFAKVDDKGKDCQTSGDEPSMAAAVESLVVTQVCDDADRCTNDGIAGVVCQNTPVTCSEHHACDFRTGTCEYSDCCLLSGAEGLCVVEIPVGQIATSQTFCQGVDSGNTNLTLINFGPNCIGWRATGADDCF